MSRVAHTLRARIAPAVLALAFLGGCATAPDPAAAEPAAASPFASPPAGSTADAALTLSPWAHVGRVVTLDPVARTAVVEVAPFASPVSAGLELLIRTTDLRLVARLTATTQQRGRFVGCEIVTGQVREGDEVVRAR